jgi:hypothetical protein
MDTAHTSAENDRLKQHEDKGAPPSTAQLLIKPSQYSDIYGGAGLGYRIHNTLQI